MARAKRLWPNCCADLRSGKGAIEVDGKDIRTLEIAGWRSRITAVFQDFIRFELSLRENVAPAGAPDGMIRRSLEEAGVAHVAALDTILSRGYPDGTDLSGGQWQRIALARTLCAVNLAQVWFCWMSPRRNSMCAAKPRFSGAFWPRRAR